MVFEIIISIFIIICLNLQLLSCAEYPKLYQELGCKPTRRTCGSSPESFVCPDFSSINNTHCHYKQKTYNINQYISSSDAPPCRKECLCSEYPDGARFKCPIVDGPIIPGSNCVLQNTLGSCNTNVKMCGSTAKLPMCYVLGKPYSKGNFIYPIDACYKCVCNEQFDNSTTYSANKNCKPIDCEVELRNYKKLQEGCAPIFYGENGCCPIGFRCPLSSDYVVPSTLSGNNDGQPTCKFGNLILQRFDQLNDSNNCIDCECKVPPMVQCVKQPECLTKMS